MTRPQIQQTEDKSAPRSQTMGVWWAIFVLSVITLLAYSNAAHDALVLDDKVFVGPQSILGLESHSEAFFRDIWEKRGVNSGLYRPLLLINFNLENHLFQDWVIGYHLVNIFTHLLASLLLFGFLLHLVRKLGGSGKTAMLAALLAAAIFAVHPVHTEVVNSVFNRSSIYVSISAILGLWWLSHWLETRPVTAWLGLAFFYTVGILCKESALVIPGIAVALVFLFSDKSLGERIRRLLPVFGLLIPIAIFFYLRHLALTTGIEGADNPLTSVPESALIPDLNSVVMVLGNLGNGLKVLLWPNPLQLFYPQLSPTELGLLIALQCVLVGLAGYLFFKDKPGLAAGLAFYYIAMLPASRVFGMDPVMPHLAERYLYFPSVGLAITLAIALMNVIKRFSPRLPILIGLPLIIFLSILTWERNHEWSSEFMLFKTEYDRGYRGSGTIRLIISKMVKDENYLAVIDVCEENPLEQAWYYHLAKACAFSYMQFKQFDDAIASFEPHTNRKENWFESSMAIADILIQTGRRQEGADRYADVINRTEEPARKEVLKGILYLRLYPGNREKALEARRFFEKALEIDPDSKYAMGWIEKIDSLLTQPE